MSIKMIIFLHITNKKDTFSCIIIVEISTTKGGVLNDKLELKKLLIYMNSVYQIPKKIKQLSDKRKRKSIPLFNIFMPVLLLLILQYESFHTFFSAPESMKKRLKHCIRGKIPKVDAVRDSLALADPKELQTIHESVIQRSFRNRVFQGGTIGGYLTAAIDGVEWFSSTKKKGRGWLKRNTASGGTEYFAKSVVCATVGGNPHLILGQEMLRPRDGAGKEEGELTGGKHLLENLNKRYGHFADVIVADALYLNAPFINTVLELGMDAVIRLKDEKRLVFQDAEGLFRQGEGRKADFKRGKVKIEAWDLSGFEMREVSQKVRVIKYRETERVNGKETHREMYLVTTLEYADYKILWSMMHKRWDIEENGFHQLKTYYHAKHCYCKEAVEAVLLLTILGFNIRELYLYRRIRNFETSGITRKSVSRKLRDDLLIEDVKEALYRESG